MRERITFEGFVDLDSGWEFDAPLFVLSPVRQAEIPIGNAGGVDLFVEDYMIDLGCEKTPYTDASDHYLWDEIEKGMEEAKKGDERLKYWRRVIEYDPQVLINEDSDTPWTEVERFGYGA